MRKLFFLSLTVSLIVLVQLVFLYSSSGSPTAGSVAGIRTKTSAVTVTAMVGQYGLSLTGYTSPYAQVTIEGASIFDQVYANNQGYFEFDNRFSPASPAGGPAPNSEACLMAKDQLGRSTAPVCLPPFPTASSINIGPVIMPPTLSLDKGDYFIGDEVVLSGQTIPNTEVNISTFIDERKSILNYLALVKPALALTFPRLQTTADDKGNFSLSVPSSNARFFRLFTQTKYLDQNSPKSITLNFKILPIWMIIVKFFLFILSQVKLRLWEIIILAEIIALIVYFMRQYLHPDKIAKNRTIVRRGGLTLQKRDVDLMKMEKYRAV